MPTLLVLGGTDPIYEADRAAARVRSVAPRVRIQVIPDGGHLFVSHRPAETRRALLDLFAA